LRSADEDDASFESLDDATSSGEGGELVEEVSNGFFFVVARVPAPPPEDHSLVPATSSSGSESGNSFGDAEGSLVESFRSATNNVLVEVLDAGARSGLDGAIADGNGTGVEGWRGGC
jgi:hypothetical protein